MKLSKKVFVFSFIFSILLIILMDKINITKYIDYYNHIDNVIANTITFISILIGFISSIYIMIQQNKKSSVMELIRKYNLLGVFNNSFKNFIYMGFIDILLLIFLNLVVSNFIVFKITIYFTFPTTILFLLASFDIIMTICKMISSEEKLDKLNNNI